MYMKYKYGTINSLALQAQILHLIWVITGSLCFVCLNGAQLISVLNYRPAAYTSSPTSPPFVLLPTSSPILPYLHKPSELASHRPP